MTIDHAWDLCGLLDEQAKKSKKIEIVGAFSAKGGTGPPNGEEETSDGGENFRKFPTGNLQP